MTHSTLSYSRALTFYGPELVGFAVLVALAIAACGWPHIQETKSALRGLDGLMPFAVFNQQIITGRSLQRFIIRSYWQLRSY